MIILMPMLGINQGVQPIIGYNYGAKNYGRVKEALKYATITVTAFILFEMKKISRLESNAVNEKAGVVLES